MISLIQDELFSGQGYDPAPPMPESESKEKAIAQVEENNSPDPIKTAIRDAIAILGGIPAWAEVTSETVLPDLDQYGFTDNRAAGPIMRKLATLGYITPEPNGKHVKSTRANNHQRPIRVYLRKP